MKELLELVGADLRARRLQLERELLAVDGADDLAEDADRRGAGGALREVSELERKSGVGPRRVVHQQPVLTRLGHVDDL